MKINFYYLLFLSINFLVFAQEISPLDAVKTIVEAIENPIEKTETKYWTKSGNLNLLLNQSSFENWVAGGQNNLAVNAGINYGIHYLKDKTTWDTKIILQYGLAKVEEQDFTKTDDRLEINSLAGKKLQGNWYGSAFVNFKTQMDKGFDPATGATTTQLFSPSFIQLGPGLLWKKSNNLSVNIAPATSKLILVHKRFTDIPLLADQITFNANGGSFGVKANETIRYELGASVSTYYKLILMENISMENTLNLFSNYLEETENVDVDYTMNLVMKINKYLSSNLSVQMIYDDNAFEGLQVRQVLGLGVNVSL